MATSFKPQPVFPAFPEVTLPKSGKRSIPSAFQNVMVFDPAFLRGGTSYIANGARTGQPFMFGITGKKTEGILFYALILPANMVNVPATVAPTFVSWVPEVAGDDEASDDEASDPDAEDGTDADADPDAEVATD